MVVEMNLKEDDPSRFKINRDKIINRGDTFDFAVGKKSLVRAKLILDSFVKAVEKRGLKIMNCEGITFLLISEEKIQIRLWEKSRFLEQDENSCGFRDQELSGELYFQYMRRCTCVEKQWGDTPYSKLEEKLGRVNGSLEYIGKKEHEQRLIREEYWREYERKQVIIKEENAKKEAEFSDFKGLLGQSIRWERTQAIRKYINCVEVNPNSTIQGIKDRDEWISWAKAKADWYDPTTSCDDIYLNEFSSFHEELLEGKKRLDRNNVCKL